MAKEGDVLLKVEDVRVELGGRKILDGVSFEIKDRTRPGVTTGQIVALLGPSGVGKTTLLRSLAGLDTPTSGRILGEKDVPLAPGSVGVVFQNYPLLRHRTLLDNLVVAGGIAGLNKSKATDQAKALLQRFGLAEQHRHFPSQLSGGQRQRAAIAQQLMHQRQLLIFDEPFSGLDPAALVDVVEMLVEVANMHDTNTLIIITHDIRAALLCSDLVFMMGRNFSQEGKPISGASIKRTYDLVERGLAWHPHIEQDPRFGALELEIKSAFRSL